MKLLNRHLWEIQVDIQDILVALFVFCTRLRKMGRKDIVPFSTRHAIGKEFPKKKTRERKRERANDRTAVGRSYCCTLSSLHYCQFGLDEPLSSPRFVSSTDGFALQTLSMTLKPSFYDTIFLFATSLILIDFLFRYFSSIPGLNFLSGKMSLVARVRHIIPAFFLAS